MLCNGQLFACAGHRVSRDMFHLLTSQYTNAVVMIRHPFYRLQSDYHYIYHKPNTQHLSPEIDIAALGAVIRQEYPRSWLQYIRYPGVSNCMTKMLNGYACGADIATVLTEVTGNYDPHMVHILHMWCSV